MVEKMNLDKFSIIDIEVFCTPEIFGRGESYYREGHLIASCCLENVISGKVIGTGGIYIARLWLEDSDIHWECNCPYPDFCKHLVALVFAWTENKVQFINLTPILSQKLSQPSEIPGLLWEMINHNPIGFYEICQKETPVSNGFVTNRGLFNLIRNIFSQTYFRPNDLEVLWDKIEQIYPLLDSKLSSGEQEVLESVFELWNSLKETFQHFQNPKMMEVLIENLIFIQKIPQYFGFVQFETLTKELFQDYLNPLFWGIGGELRKTILILVSSCPENFLNRLAELVEVITDEFQLIAILELLTTFPEDAAKIGLLNKVEQILLTSSDGRLRLIDYLIEKRPDEAYKLTKSSLKSVSAVDEKIALRERLIELHQRKNEFKQAASYCYLQFVERPNLEEYLRLKRLLDPFKDEFQGYRQKIESYLLSKNLRHLWLALQIKEAEFKIIPEYLPEILADRSLIALIAGELSSGNQHQPEISTIYPRILVGLFDQYHPDLKEIISKLLVDYKKKCYQGNMDYLWENFRQEINYRYSSTDKTLIQYKKILML